MPANKRCLHWSFCTCLLIALLPTTALAGGNGLVGGNGLIGGYVGLDATSISVQNDGGEETNPRGVRLRLGMRVSRAFDIEGHFGTGSDSSVESFDKFSTSYAAAYLKGYLPVGRRSALYGLAGFSAIEFSQRIDGQRFIDDRHALSFGFGLETQLSRHLDMSADFIMYSLDDQIYSDLSAVNFGLKYYF